MGGCCAEALVMVPGLASGLHWRGAGGSCRNGITPSEGIREQLRSPHAPVAQRPPSRRQGLNPVR